MNLYTNFGASMCAGASAMDYVDPFADPELPDRYFLLVAQQQDSAAMDVSVDAEATGNQVSFVNVRG